jgi:hypothetical protein
VVRQKLRRLEVRKVVNVFKLGMMKIECRGLRYIDSPQMREDIARTRAPHLPDWTGANKFFQQGGEPVDEEGLSCPRVDSVQA